MHTLIVRVMPNILHCLLSIKCWCKEGQSKKQVGSMAGAEVLILSLPRYVFIGNIWHKMHSLRTQGGCV